MMDIKNEAELLFAQDIAILNEEIYNKVVELVQCIEGKNRAEKDKEKYSTPTLLNCPYKNAYQEAYENYLDALNYFNDKLLSRIQDSYKSYIKDITMPHPQTSLKI